MARGEIQHMPYSPTCRDVASISLRPVQDGDKDFIFDVFVASRWDLEWIVGLDEVQKAAMYRQQFFSDEECLKREFAGADCSIVLLYSQPIGRFYVYRGEKFIHGVTIGLLPEFRGRGIGGYLTGLLQKEALETNRLVRIRVAWYNYSAQGLYEKLGFRVVHDAGAYLEMEWMPDGSTL
ncbi:MAG: GNAT family N-acetyltransferase [Clostridia bacterium]|nr:GNAT family N-acetyltransferase [Clostridia bacterium]